MRTRTYVLDSEQVEAAACYVVAEGLANVQPSTAA